MKLSFLKSMQPKALPAPPSTVAPPMDGAVDPRRGASRTVPQDHAVSGSELQARRTLFNNATPFLSSMTRESAFKARPTVRELKDWVAHKDFDPLFRDKNKKNIWNKLADCQKITGDDIESILSMAVGRGLKTRPDRDNEAMVSPLDAAIDRKNSDLVFTFLHYDSDLGALRMDGDRIERLRSFVAERRDVLQGRLVPKETHRSSRSWSFTAGSDSVDRELDTLNGIERLIEEGGGVGRSAASSSVIRPPVHPSGGIETIIDDVKRSIETKDLATAMTRLEALRDLVTARRSEGDAAAPDPDARRQEKTVRFALPSTAARSAP